MSKVTYPVFMVDDRIVFHAEDTYVLFDTGFPCSISVSGSIGPFKTDTSFSPVPDGDIKSFFDRFLRLELPDQSKVTAIFNPMGRFNCYLSPQNITISDETETIPGHDYFLPFAQSRLPIVEGIMNGVQARFFFDSGARMTMFGDKTLTGGKPSIGNYSEWMAMIHQYAELPLYEAVLEFPCGLHYVGKGALVEQPEYAGPCRMMNVQGMLGIDFLKEYDLYFSLNNVQKGIAFLRR